MRVYIDTSVVGGCLDPEFEKWSELLFKEFEVGKKIAVISDVTLQELENAREEVRGILNRVPDKYKETILLDHEAKELSQHYIREKIVTIKSLVDTRHIAMATTNRVNLLVSWNFKHIVNYNRIRLYNSVNLKYGYPIIDIRTPREVLDEK